MRSLWIIKKLELLAYKAFRLTARPLRQTGLGRFRTVKTVCMYLLNNLMPEQTQHIDVHGHKMFVHVEKYKPTDDIGREMIFWGVYDRYATFLFEKFIKEGMNVIDVGANIGYYTLLGARLVGEKGRIFAFEPERRNYELLLKNIELNGYKNVIPLQKAVSYKTGKARLYVDRVNGGIHSLYKTNQDANETTVVDTISLDDFFKNRECTIHCIKIDVEGAEMTVLMGMSEIVRKNKNIKIFIEFWPEVFQRSGFSPQEYWAKLIDYGLKCIYLIDEEKQKLEITDLEKTLKFCNSPSHHVVNLLCSRTPVRDL